MLIRSRNDSTGSAGEPKIHCHSQAHPVRQPWIAHGEPDTLIAGQEDGQRSRSVKAERRL